MNKFSTTLCLYVTNYPLDYQLRGPSYIQLGQRQIPRMLLHESKGYTSNIGNDPEGCR